MAVRIDAHGASERGRLRSRNTDQFLVAELAETMRIRSTSLPGGPQARLDGASHGHLCVVADGVPPACSGEVAGELAVETITRRVLDLVPWFFYLDGESDAQLKNEFAQTFRQCDSVVREVSVDEAFATPAATALTLAYLYPPQLFVVHVGDTRCYVYASGKLHHLTTDHTLARQIGQHGTRTGDAVPARRLRSVLSQVIGGPGTSVEPEVRLTVAWAGDTVLLSTDGLTSQVSDREIEAVLRTDTSAASACDRLIDAANRAGGDDNVTVVVVRLG